MAALWLQFFLGVLAVSQLPPWEEDLQISVFSVLAWLLGLANFHASFSCHLWHGLAQTTVWPHYQEGLSPDELWISALPA